MEVIIHHVGRPSSFPMSWIMDLLSELAIFSYCILFRLLRMRMNRPGGRASSSSRSILLRNEFSSVSSLYSILYSGTSLY